MRKAIDSLNRRAEKPVGPLEFLESPRYLNAKDILFPVPLEAYLNISSGNWVECVLTGGIGAGKTTVAIYVIAYQLYLLSRMENPQRTLGLDPASEIGFVFQSKTLTLAMEVGYERFSNLIRDAPYFKENFQADPHIKSRLMFPNRIIAKPVVGAAAGTLGQNILGGVIDELNFMETVEKSTKTGEGESYDQAESIYNSLATRRKTRFLSGGKMLGMLCLVSSKNYRGQFLDKKVEQARVDPESGIYVYDKRVWDMKPWEYCGDVFRVFGGDLTRKPRILAPGEEVADTDQHLVIEVPIEFRKDFEADIMQAMRDLAGVSTTVVHPFIMEPEKVEACFRHDLRSVLSTTSCDFRDTKLAVYPKHFVSPLEPRFAHVDLAATGDSCGVAVGHVIGFRTVERGLEMQEILPIIRFDCILEVKPPRGGEIIFSKVRDLLYALRTAGLNLTWVTYDSWQSRDSLQMLRQKGFVTGEVSVDRDTLAYDLTKSALYDGRVFLPYHYKAVKEFMELELDAKHQKIDHPAHGSKDLADAIAGVVSGLTRRREVWSRHGVRPTDIPRSIQEKIATTTKNSPQ